MRRGVIVAFHFFVLFLSVKAMAGPRQFLPHFFGSTGDMTFEGVYSSELDKRSSVERKTSEKNLVETLNLGTAGYVYHPNLLYFTLDFAGEVSRNSRRNGNQDDKGTWKTLNEADEEYKLAGYVFVQKPYNLDFKVSQERPFLTSGISNTGRVVSDFKSEANVNVRKRPLFARVGVQHNIQKTETQASLSNVARQSTGTVDAVRGNVSYGGRNYTVSGYATHRTRTVTSDSATDTLVSSSGTSTSDQGNVLGSFQYKNMTSTTVADIVKDEARLTDFSRFKIRENLDVKLPWNMDSTVKLEHERYDSTTIENVSALGQTVYNETNNISGEVRHKLFESIYSAVSADFNRSNTTTDKRTAKSFKADVDYNKRLPGGGLRMQLRNDLNIVDQDGTPTIRGEEHAVRIDGGGADPLITDTIELNRTRAIASTVRVEVYNATANIESWQEVPQTGNWSIQGNAENVQVKFVDFLVTPPLPDDDNDGDYKDQQYQVRVNYSLPEAEYSTTTSTSGFNAGINLFGDTFSSDYSHFLTTQKYRNGDETFGLLSPEVTRDKISVSFVRDPVSLSSFYRWIASKGYDEDRWFVSGKYSGHKQITRDFSTNWAASHFWDDVVAKETLTGTTRATQKETLLSLVATYGLPRLKSTVVAQSDYAQKRGVIPNFRLNSDGFWQKTIQVASNENKYTNAVTMYTLLPWLKIHASVRGEYNLSENVSSNVDTITRIVLTKFSKDWSFGATTVSLRGEYRVSDTDSKNKTRHTVTPSGEEDAEISVVVKRQLF